MRVRVEVSVGDVLRLGDAAFEVVAAAGGRAALSVALLTPVLAADGAAVGFASCVQSFTLRVGESLSVDAARAEVRSADDGRLVLEVDAPAGTRVEVVEAEYAPAGEGEG